MNKFENGMSQWGNNSKTENNANAYKTTQNALIDFFSNAGAMRNNSADEIRSLFRSAYQESEVGAIILSFYFRDVRGGQGERRFFKECFSELIKMDKEKAKKLLALIPEYGRWDDIFIAEKTSLEGTMLNMISEQLYKDLKDYSMGNDISILAKWLPSERRHGKTDKFALKIAKHAGLSPKMYRKSLSMLRKHLNIVERKLSSRSHHNINYSTVPSQAMRKYYGAFYRKDGERFEEFLREVKNGNKTINTSTLYPYQIIAPFTDYWGDKNYDSNEEALEVMWDNLPEYFEDGGNTLIMADTSGSMTGMPMDMAVSLAIYCAERNSGFYHNKFMSFSARPELIDISAGTLKDKAQKVMRTDWGMNTNLQKAFEKVLEVAVRAGASQSELPDRIIVISDMQFDEGVMAGSKDRWTRPFSESEYMTLNNEIKKKYKSYGYEMPKLVYWNVDATAGTYPMKEDEKGLMVSGASPEIMAAVLKDDMISPIDIVNEVLERKRYEKIVNLL